MNADRVRLEIADGVAVMTLCRPDAMNGIDLPMAKALSEAAHEIAASSDVRAVLIRGEGKSFCCGGDLKAFASAGDSLPALLREVTTNAHAAITLLSELGAPIVAAVQGAVAGGGLGFALGADILLAAESARFVFAYSAIGLSPDCGASWFLPRLVGPRRAMELAMTNRPLGAAEALEIGLVTRVLPDDELLGEATKLVGTLAQGATGSLAATKRLLRSGWDSSLAEQLAREAVTLSDRAGRPDGREGVAAFAEKRPPQFTGA